MTVPPPSPMGRAEVDRILGALGAAHDRASAAMYALDSRPELALLRDTRPTGETARVAADVLARTGALWSQFAAFGALLGQAREVRARRSRPGDTELRELGDLLGAPVVALDADGTVLDDPAAAPAHRIGVTELARRIEAEATALAGTLAGLEAARSRLAGWFGQLTDALRWLRADAVELSGPGRPDELAGAGGPAVPGAAPPAGSQTAPAADLRAVPAAERRAVPAAEHRAGAERRAVPAAERRAGPADGAGAAPPLAGELDRLDRLDRAVEEAYRDAVADPLGAAGTGSAATALRDRLRRFEAEVAALTGRLAELTEVRDGYPGRTARLAAELDDLVTAAGETARTHALARDKIANSALPELSPDPTPALRAQFAQLDQVHREHRWSQVGRELAALERGVVDARRRMAESHEAADGLLRRRAELRGRLDAYRAKAGRLGLIEHPELSARYRQARDLLYTSPCDLSAATRAVVAYQRHLNDLAERPAPGAKGALP
ncbi:hypothetical protein GCM10022225_38600 [Plantactinospora mayteni]|uniref:Uncharacterized protein n=1 Tax=Plantactinospora mayteni TaxID=566021 RepID=A0ABQ4EWU9_9ACTN|nr:hypothetical protein [Plantactinospora mayteni]GIG99121.1 hypothetical protein Pma05_56940 [Plantactinospora mayteni]